MGSLGIKLCAVSISHAAYVTGKFNNCTLHTKAQAQEWNLVLTGILNSLNLAFNTTITKAARYQNTLAASKFLIQIQSRVLDLLGIYPVNLYSSIIGNTCMVESFSYRNISIWQLYILTNYSHLYLLLRILNLVDHLSPVLHIYRTVIHTQLLQNNAIQAFLLHHQRNLINGISSQILNNSLFLYIAEQSQLLLHILGQRLLSTAYQNIWLNTNAPQFLYTVLGWLSLKLASGRDIRNQSNMNVQYIVTANFLLDLANSLHKWQGLNITYSTTDFGNNYICTIAGSHIINTLLNLIGDMRNNLDSLAQIITTALLVKNIPINLTSGNIRAFGQININETLIMAQIQISLSTIISNENLAMLIRAHSTWININIWIKLLNSNLNTTIL